MLLGSTQKPKHKEVAAMAASLKEPLVGRAIEWCCLLFLICLLYKLASIGVGILAIIVALGFVNVKTAPLKISSISIWAVLYVMMATVTAFLVDPYEGCYRSAQCVLVVSSGVVVAKHFKGQSAEALDRFIRTLIFTAVAIFLNIIIYHISIQRFAGWKLLYDTKFVFSLLPVLFFLKEDTIRKRFGPIIWWLLIGALTSLILIAGERKSYVLLTCLFLFSNGSRLGKGVILLLLSVVLAFFLSLSSGGYVEGHILSLFDSHKDISTQHLMMDKDLVYNSDRIREFVNRNAREQFFENPILGLGATGYQAWATSKFRGVNLGLATNVHGEIGRVPVEGGLVGIGIALAYVFCAIRGVFLHMRRKGGLRIPSRDKLPLYLSFLVLSYASTEALNTLMLEVILLFGFYLAAIEPPRGTIKMIKTLEPFSRS